MMNYQQIDQSEAMWSGWTSESSVVVLPSLSVTDLPLTYYHAISLPLILALFKRFLRGSYAPEETPEICLPEPGLRPARLEEHRSHCLSRTFSSEA